MADACGSAARGRPCWGVQLGPHWPWRPAHMLQKLSGKGVECVTWLHGLSAGGAGMVPASVGCALHLLCVSTQAQSRPLIALTKSWEGFGRHPQCSGPLLVLHAGITPGGVHGPLWGARRQFSCTQGRCSGPRSGALREHVRWVTAVAPIMARDHASGSASRLLGEDVPGKRSLLASWLLREASGVQLGRYWGSLSLSPCHNWVRCPRNTCSLRPRPGRGPVASLPSQSF